MKALTFIFVCLCQVCCAQLIVDGKNLSGDKTIQYIQLTQLAKGPKEFVYQISFPGQPDKGLETGKDIQNAAGKPSFKTVMDAINFIANEGWELFSEATPTSGTVRTYTFKRKES